MAGVTIALLSLILLLFVYFKRKRQLNPPGPKPLPLLGNLLDFPVHEAWLTYNEWRKEYGDVIYMNILGTPMVILNSFKTCNDLFDNRSAKYSSRPRMVMINELMGWDAAFVLMPYSPRWRKYRRLFHRYFNETASVEYHVPQQQGTYTFLQQVHKEPERLFDHIRFLFGNTMIESIYGVKVKGPEDVLLKQAEATVQSVMDAAIPGQYIADVFPPAKYIPSWFPGAGFKRQAAEWNNLGQRARNDPFNEVKIRMERGTARPSVVSAMLSEWVDDENPTGVNHEDLVTQEPPEQIIKNCTATAYLAGFDTIVSSIQTFFMVMANHPGVQRTAQAELDRLLEGSRLPTFEDAKALPFVSAIVKELLRWHSFRSELTLFMRQNPLPLSIAHYLIEDDEYNGYILREGTIVLGNTWSILHDPEVYTDPLTFNPWRWIVETPDGMQINEALPDPTIAVFGYGRRICPGRHFAINSLYILIASVLSCFDIRPLDSERRPAERVEELFTSGLISYPRPFNVSVTFRSDKMAQLLSDIES